MKKVFPFFVLLFFCSFACQNPKNDYQQTVPEHFTKVPEWAKEVVWYQIFVERFRNGDSTNDPTPDDIRFAYPDSIPADWEITPWTQDWYKPDGYFLHSGLTQFQDNLQLRRYGGDLQGVLDKLDYLSDLGITAIYFNPLNDAPSLHKYDPRYWHHIDRNFGPDPKGDAKIIQSEDPANPQNWQWTQADQLFLKVVEACHRRGIKVIVDYSWNHTGMDFWALNDIRKHGKDSPFADWYAIESFDNPSTPENELKYKGWYHIKYLPEIQKAVVGNDSVFPFEGNFQSPSVKEHIFAVAARWLDPNKDGNPADGIDGFRLDVAAEIPLGFWPEFRSKVREINPEAYLVGEVWWQKYPDDLMDPRPFLKGTMFDAVMNYRWYRPTRQFFSQAEPAIGPKAFADSMKQILEGINPYNAQVMMNLTASHDAPRTATSLYNKNKYKFRAKPYDDANYRIEKPDGETRWIQKMLLIHQYTFVGAPHIWYGDEVGMWGADDPDTRKPMVWGDITYEPETSYPQGKLRKPDVVETDTQLFQFIKELIQLRKQHPALVHGTLEFLVTEDKNGTLLYKRTYNGDVIWVAFNISKNQQTITLEGIEDGLHSFYSVAPTSQKVLGEKLDVTLRPQSGGVFFYQ
ncbi:MAG TPA: alpha-amylase [Marinilabiliales bacterium]|nr:MAG: hypothetical protein A2W84_05190 [Bacteroidetes bacterium GWC2_40_13]OFX75463.1 MAG: hypothetical protein A2W96_08380 [Bacteroidetes bacterium GWD2_40_43]OFX93978.1 MAG: hypothetical protein A2W97_14305 [Bacteroidetes bacterium GWE2_40_63]OFY19767.1 MAG: hypothetical protein A2W88_03175 [Bacteroidetes bacterium GWF2_40_13]HAN00093.1 alpha-amylase [Marinilabiliales bacterium]